MREAYERRARTGPTLSHVAKVLRALGRLDEAHDCFNRSLQLAESDPALTNYWLRGEIRTHRAAVLIDLGRRSEAEADLREALAIFERLGNAEGHLRTATDLSQLLA